MPSTVNSASLLPGRTATWDRNGLVQEIVEQYQVLRAFTDVQFDPNAITGMPTKGAAHPTLSALTVVAHEPREDPTGVRWVVAVKYAREGLTSSAGKRTKREWSTVDASRDLMTDAGTGDPVLNVNGDPFDRVPQVFQADRSFRIVRLENTAPATGLAKSGTINNADTTGPGSISIPKHCGLLRISCRDLDPTGASTPDYKYEYVYDIHYRVNMVTKNGDTSPTNIGWDESFIERGFIYLVDGNPVRAVEDVDLGPPEGTIKRPSQDPVLLAGDGTKLPWGANPIITIVQAIPDADWSSLNLNS